MKKQFVNIDWITRFRIVGWFDAYYQPEKLKNKEPGFRERYINSLIDDFKRAGKCSISRFDSTTGTQIDFDNDPNKIL